jgi:hypothetical protein
MKMKEQHFALKMRATALLVVMVFTGCIESWVYSRRDIYYRHAAEMESLIPKWQKFVVVDGGTSQAPKSSASPAPTDDNVSGCYIRSKLLVLYEKLNPHSTDVKYSLHHMDSALEGENSNNEMHRQGLIAVTLDEVGTLVFVSPTNYKDQAEYGKPGSYTRYTYSTVDYNVRVVDTAAGQIVCSTVVHNRSGYTPDKLSVSMIGYPDSELHELLISAPRR